MDMFTTTKDGRTAKLTPEERLLVDLRCAPFRAKEVPHHDVVTMNALANLTRKGLARWVRGAYEITDAGRAAADRLNAKAVN